MNSYTLDFDQLFNTTKLYSDYLTGDLHDYYRYNFQDKDNISKAANIVNNSSYDRERIYQIVLENNKRLGASDSTIKNIELLKNPETVCVFSGQQVAFCSSPMYTIYKAMTSVKLADRYRRSLNRPVVPCFWMPTDDHDFEEVRSANFLLRSGKLKTVTYQPRVDPSGSPVADMVLDDGVLDFYDLVNEALIDTEFKGSLLEIFRQFYTPGSKLSEAFARVFNHFLGDLGIILIDPNFAGLKEFFKPVFIKEALEHNQTQKLFEQRTRLLLKNGFHAQVHKTGDNLNIFYHDKKRLNMTSFGDEYCPDGSSERFSPQSLCEIIEKSPDRFSSNVLLRPIAQCTAFPVVCQVVGPSELAYFAQIEPLFEYFDVPFPIIYPRSGMTIVEPHIKKILHKYRINLPDLRGRLEPVIGEVVEKLFPSEAAELAISLSACIKDDLDRFSKELKDSDPEGYQHINNFRKFIDFELKQLQKKLKTSNKKRHDELTSQIRKTYSFLFPDGRLQERVLSPFYFANKYGKDIFKSIYEHLNVDRPAHSVLEL